MSASYDSMWAELEPVGRSASGGYRRFAWTSEDATLREWFAAEAGRRGLGVVEDRAGNQWAWLGDPDASGPGLAIGSHLDSVPEGGAYDGPLGVVSAFAALDLLRDNGFEPARPVAVVNFVDEEGARFGVACAGSRVVTGALAAERALGLRDGDGVTMAEALRAAGRDPASYGSDDEALRRVGTFVELHVEQGRWLADPSAHGVERDPEAVGVASAIWPHGRWRFDHVGTANHAGTTALTDRDDPMLAHARLVLAARSAAEARGALATVGKVRVAPNGVNAIPSQVTSWLDARGPSEAAVREVVADLAALGVEPAEESWTGETAFDAGLRDRLAALLGSDGRPAPVLPTGAGHDAGILAATDVPTAMLFVRNPTGVSHSPAEFAEVADCHAGVEALARVVRELAS